jgi:hypothetical protein
MEGEAPICNFFYFPVFAAKRRDCAARSLRSGQGCDEHLARRLLWRMDDSIRAG